MLRQDGVLDRPEQCRLRAHHEQQRQQQAEELEPDRHRRRDHRHQLQQLETAHQPLLVEVVGERAAPGGEQKERQDEQSRCQIVEQSRIPAVARHGDEGQQQQ